MLINSISGIIPNPTRVLCGLCVYPSCSGILEQLLQVIHSEFQLFTYTTEEIVTCMHIGILYVGCLIDALLESFLVAGYFICNTVDMLHIVKLSLIAA